MNKEFLYVCLLFLLGNIFVWFQVNAQIKWEWFKNNYFILALLGIPISYMFMHATLLSYKLLGTLWSSRLFAFGISMVSFPIMTWLIMNEPITLKIVVSVILAFLIIILQIK